MIEHAVFVSSPSPSAKPVSTTKWRPSGETAGWDIERFPIAGLAANCKREEAAPLNPPGLGAAGSAMGLAENPNGLQIDLNQLACAAVLHLRHVIGRQGEGIADHIFVMFHEGISTLATVSSWTDSRGSGLRMPNLRVRTEGDEGFLLRNLHAVERMAAFAQGLVALFEAALLQIEGEETVALGVAAQE